MLRAPAHLKPTHAPRSGSRARYHGRTTKQIMIISTCALTVSKFGIRLCSPVQHTTGSFQVCKKQASVTASRLRVTVGGGDRYSSSYDLTESVLKAGRGEESKTGVRMTNESGTETEIEKAT
ncbi:hypothetical protein EVAR_64228_1 [Eumeta japonica]|uniref:Uncharacterized protein n=1 Tax=Eumeta variegata TaxID=151549 RepID=A0A4C1ZT96_EUMVA|nr:hypothetical protein EVAR_64228_1 [Eumeta japonica]